MRAHTRTHVRIGPQPYPLANNSSWTNDLQPPSPFPSRSASAQASLLTTSQKGITTEPLQPTLSWTQLRRSSSRPPPSPGYPLQPYISAWNTNQLLHATIPIKMFRQLVITNHPIDPHCTPTIILNFVPRMLHFRYKYHDYITVM